MIVGAFALASEIALVIGAWVLGGTAAGGVAGLVAGVIAAGGVVVIWGRWCAPRSRTRLADPRLVLVQAALFAMTAGGLFVTGHPRLALVIAIGGTSLAAVRIVDPHDLDRPRATGS
ncbi:MAG: DUF2568 domain-containing protein [Thermoleophilia bacterium]